MRTYRVFTVCYLCKHVAHLLKINVKGKVTLTCDACGSKPKIHKLRLTRAKAKV